MSWFASLSEPARPSQSSSLSLSRFHISLTTLFLHPSLLAFLVFLYPSHSLSLLLPLSFFLSISLSQQTQLFNTYYFQRCMMCCNANSSRGVHSTMTPIFYPFLSTLSLFLSLRGNFLSFSLSSRKLLWLLRRHRMEVGLVFHSFPMIGLKGDFYEVVVTRAYLSEREREREVWGEKRERRIVYQGERGE